jgi:hypothetical protein
MYKSHHEAQSPADPQALDAASTCTESARSGAKDSIARIAVHATSTLDTSSLRHQSRTMTIDDVTGVGRGVDLGADMMILGEATERQTRASHWSMGMVDGHGSIGDESHRLSRVT